MGWKFDIVRSDKQNSLNNRNLLAARSEKGIVHLQGAFTRIGSALTVEASASSTPSSTPDLYPAASTLHPPKMTSQPASIITDPFLTSVLSAADLARQQCVALLDLLDAHPLPPNTPPSRETELELSKQQKLLYSYLARARGLNRSAILGVRQTKQATAEARQEIDTLHLQLQNLYYEQRHLRGEIGACEAYE